MIFRLYTSISPFRLVFLICVSIGLLVPIVLFDGKVANVVNAKPNLINTWPECPPQSDTIWVELAGTHSPTGARNVVEIPFDTGTVWINGYEYDNYIRGVSAGEVSTTTEPGEGTVVFDNETLKAMNVAIRTKVYHLCGNAGYGYVFPDNNGITRHGIAGQVVQDYQYNKALVDYTQSERERYQAAVDNTADEYLTYSGDTFDIFYRSIGGENTRNIDPNGPHKGIYDPAGSFHTEIDDDPGLLQINANHWATGENHGETLPPWNYRQILAHYYTGIHLRNTSNILTPEYRWNPLTVSWASGGILPPPMVPNNQYDVNIWTQNTGIVDWPANSVRFYVEWKQIDGPIFFGQHTYPIGNNIPKGEWQNLSITNGIDTPFSSGVYTLTIDMELVSTWQTFRNREAGRPWYPLRYVCRIGNGGQCYWPDEYTGGEGGDIYLPIIMKNAL